MAEQNKNHSQIKTLPEPESQSQNPITQPESNSQSPANSSVESNASIPIPQPTATVALSPNSSAAEISHNSANPAKIPIRPQKIRKLSIATLTTTTADKTTANDSSISSSVALIASTPTPTPNSSTLKNRRRTASQAARALPQIIKPLSFAGETEIAIRHLSSVDPLLAPLIATHPPPQFESRHPPFLALTKSILYQQLAYKAGTSIYTRFVSLCGGEESVFPDSVLALSSQQLKQIGVSGRKASYLHDLANKYKSGILSDETVVKMDDRSLFTMLSMVKGIGSWSVHMFMIFSLHRPDVLPVSDLGVRKGVQLLYGLEELPRPSQMEQLCEKWKPYRSVGAWYMWRFVEGKGAQAAGNDVALGANGNNVQPLQQIEMQHDGQHQHQHQHQLQYVEPVNGIANIGECIWNQ